jgi:hypothetical protein
MDALPAILTIVLVAAAAAVAVRSIAGVADRQLVGLGSLLGGWRPQPWPDGVQEEDPETGWARHGSHPRSLLSSSPLAETPVDPDDPPTSWIEELD